MSIKKKHIPALVRGIIIFIVITLVLQTCFMLSLTPDGLRFLYPYILVSKSEKITTGDADLGEYFPLHGVASDSDLIILAADTGVADTYKLAGDFLQFVERFTEVSSVVLHTQNSRISEISDAILSGDYAKFSTACDAQKDSKVLSDQLYNFLDKLYVMNSKLAPDMKFTVSGVDGIDNFGDVKLQFVSDLVLLPGAFNRVDSNILGVNDPEKFVEMFEENRDGLMSVLKDDFQMYDTYCEYLSAGTLRESVVLDNFKTYSPAESGTVFAILPQDLCAEGSEFIRMAEEEYGEVTVINTVYYDCMTVSGNKEVVRDDGAFPAFFTGIRIADANELATFRKYYKEVTNSFDSDKLVHRMNLIGEAGEKTFFIISGSGAATFNAGEDKVVTGNVDVAPG